MFEEGELPKLLAVLAKPVVFDLLLPHFCLSLDVPLQGFEDVPAHFDGEEHEHRVQDLRQYPDFGVCDCKVKSKGHQENPAYEVDIGVNKLLQKQRIETSWYNLV